MNDLIRAGALFANEDDEGVFDETVDPENLVDEDGGESEEDSDMGGWEN